MKTYINQNIILINLCILRLLFCTFIFTFLYKNECEPELKWHIYLTAHAHIVCLDMLA